MIKRIISIYVFSLLCVVSEAQIVEAKSDFIGNSIKCGFVDALGHWVIKPQYDEAYWEGSYGTFRKSYKDDTKGLVNKDGKVLFPQGKYKSFIRFELNLLGEPKKYSDNILLVEDTQGKDGLVTLQGEVIIEPKYKLITAADYSLIKVWDFSGHQGLVNYKGEVVLECKYDFINRYEKNWPGFELRYKDKYGYADSTGKVIIPVKYKFFLHSKGKSFAQVEDKETGLVGAYSSQGEILVPVDYFGVGSAGEDGIFRICTAVKGTDGKLQKGKWGYYANGKEIISCIYDEAHGFVNGVARVKKDGEVILIKNPLRKASDIKIAENVSPSDRKVGGPAVSRYPAPDSDVDKNIPTANKLSPNVFAFIIANENYPDAPVPYSLNDGRMFKEYCLKTLGLPEKNVNLYEDATFGTIITAVEKMKSIADAYEGDACVIFYYAGHGFPDDKQSTAYLLPIDGDAASIVTTGYSLAKLYKEMSQLNLKSAIVFLDACFSGAKREDQMLASSRGVTIKVKDEVPQGKMVVFSAAQGDETAHQLENKHHGLFTYFLLKELQSTGGEVNLGALTTNVTKQVKRQSVVINNKKQTPTVIPSQMLVNDWQDLKLK